MRKNLGAKTALIVVTLLLFTYFIFGTPSGVSPKKLAASMMEASPMRHGLSLGLDLRGGTHLILQVMVEEAVSAVTDNDVARTSDALKQAGVAGATVVKPDPNTPEVIRISDVPADKAGQVRDLLNNKFGTGYAVSSNDNGFTVTLQPSQANAIRTHAVQQAIETAGGGPGKPRPREHGQQSQAAHCPIGHARGALHTQAGDLPVSGIGFKEFVQSF